MKPERGLVYVCDRVFTLSSAPIPSDGENARPPTTPLLSHYLSVFGISVMENMCQVYMCVCVCVCVCVSGKCKPVLCSHYNQLNHLKVMSSRMEGKVGSQRRGQKTMTNGLDSELLTACDYDSSM